MDLPPARLLAWRVTETAGFESAWLQLRDGSLLADVRVVGQRPEPYWLDYNLATDEDTLTTRLIATARTSAGEVRLDLQQRDGAWTVDGVPRPDLAGALDVDVGASPVTNTMPILRHALHQQSGEHTFTMAFVEVPSLRVVASPQTYRHMGLDDRGAIVRFASGKFQADLLIDHDGFVVDYPTLAERIDAGGSGTADAIRRAGPGTARTS
jgi:uncharacterized protein